MGLGFRAYWFRHLQRMQAQANNAVSIDGFAILLNISFVNFWITWYSCYELCRESSYWLTKSYSVPPTNKSPSAEIMQKPNTRLQYSGPRLLYNNGTGYLNKPQKYIGSYLVFCDTLSCLMMLLLRLIRVQGSSCTDIYAVSNAPVAWTPMCSIR